MPIKTTVNDYELTVILGEKATPEDGTAKAAELTKSIEKFEGKVTKQELWGRRELAYVIKRNRNGFYITIWFTFPGKNLKALEQLLRFDESIIRFLTTKAYTTAQPGSLYPVVEEEKEKPGKGGAQEESASAEAMLRRSSGVAPKKADLAAAKEEVDDIPEEERLKKLDETLDELFKEEEEEK